MASENENSGAQVVRAGIWLLTFILVVAFWLYNPTLMEGSDPDWWTSGILPLCALFAATGVVINLVSGAIGLSIVVFAAVFK